jgi:hypothetical protein
MDILGSRNTGRSMSNIWRRITDGSMSNFGWRIAGGSMSITEPKTTV